MCKQKRLNELLTKALEISSNIWGFQRREDILDFFCNQISEIDNFIAVVIIDPSGIYNTIKEDISFCRYLHYQPRTVSVISCEDCEYACGNKRNSIIMIPYSNMSSVYFFLSDFLYEEIIYILSNLVSILSKALENLEIRLKLEEAFNQLQTNLNYFQHLADKLRNPLAVILGVTELKDDEIDCRKAFNLIRRSGFKIKKVLEEMRDFEMTTVNICNSKPYLSH